MAALSGCVGGGGQASGPVPALPASSQPAVNDVPVRIGAPYQIGGRTYTPVDQADYDEVGYASWYGTELGGRPTANGESFIPDAVTAAHRTLPLPSYVEVTRLDTGRTILVRINDRGPADPNRLIDLSAGAAEQLGITDVGMVQVRVRRTNPVESERQTLRLGRPVPVRIDTPDSLLEILRERAARLPRPATWRPPASSQPVSGTSNVSTGQGGFVVQIGAYGSRARAEEVARGTGAMVVQAGSIYRVRFAPFATEAEARSAIARAAAAGQPGAVLIREP